MRTPPDKGARAAQVVAVLAGVVLAPAIVGFVLGQGDWGRIAAIVVGLVVVAGAMWFFVARQRGNDPQ